MNVGPRNKSGCSAQYSEYSVNETGDKMNGGAVKDERSPLKEAIDFKKEVQVDELAYWDIMIGLKYSVNSKY